MIDLQSPIAIGDELEALYLLIKTAATSLLQQEIDLSMNMNLRVEEIDVLEGDKKDS